MTRHGGRSFLSQVDCARRWDACVDYGSVISAWTPRMLELFREHNGDKLKAGEALKLEQKLAKEGA